MEQTESYFLENLNTEHGSFDKETRTRLYQEALKGSESSLEVLLEEAFNVGFSSGEVNYQWLNQ